MDEWIKIKERRPNYNGKVRIKYLDNNQIKERDAWYETGNRRFKKGFSLLPKYIIEGIIEWMKI